MPYIKSVQDSVSEPVNIYYEDTIKGRPVVFIHGWPLSHDMWEYQFNELPKYGIRCIAYDRRGFGKSGKPWNGYDYDTLAGDLKIVLDELDLEDVTLVGFSMGGGEVVRYISKYGEDRISKIVLLSAVTPFMLKADDNPNGIPQETFDDFIYQTKNDRPDFLSAFGKLFYGVNIINKPVSQAMLDWTLKLALNGSPKATVECIKSFSATDFREDLKKITVPTLIIHGDSDKIVPIDMSGSRTAYLIPGAKYKIYAGAPHGLFITEKEMLNNDLITFIENGTISSETNSMDALAAESISSAQYPF